jgi:hypothetical protein
MSEPPTEEHKVGRDTFVELTHSMMVAVALGDLYVGQTAHILHACAQPEAWEERLDLTHQVRAGLTDWSEESKGGLIAVEVVQVHFPCYNQHGGKPCKAGGHVVQMTRIITMTDFNPDTVASSVNFEDVVIEATTAQHPLGDRPDLLKLAGPRRSNRGLREAFTKMFGSDEKRIDKEIESFRAELDELFPSTQSKGKEEGDEPE